MNARPSAETPRKSGLSRLQLVLLGKGMHAKTKPVDCAAWRGVAGEER